MRQTAKYILLFCPKYSEAHQNLHDAAGSRNYTKIGEAEAYAPAVGLICPPHECEDARDLLGGKKWWQTGSRFVQM